MDKKVKLKSFNGLLKPNGRISTDENYWKLIGQTGRIIEENNKDFINRALVLFDKNIDDFDLQNHNPIKNSLWILTTDLEID